LINENVFLKNTCELLLMCSIQISKWLDYKLNFQIRMDLFDHTYVRVVYHYETLVFYSLYHESMTCYTYTRFQKTYLVSWKLFYCKLSPITHRDLLRFLSHTNLFMSYRDLTLEDDRGSFFVNEILDFVFLNDCIRIVLGDYFYFENLCN
jgi:hypothetical protein